MKNIDISSERKTKMSVKNEVERTQKKRADGMSAMTIVLKDFFLMF